MTKTLVLTDEELKLLLTAVSRYQDSIPWEDDDTNEIERLEKIKQQIKRTQKQTRGKGIEL